MVLGDPLSPARSFDLFSRKTCALMCVLCVEKMIDAIGRLRTPVKNRLFLRLSRQSEEAACVGVKSSHWKEAAEGSVEQPKKTPRIPTLELRRRPVQSLTLLTGASLWKVDIGSLGYLLRRPSWNSSSSSTPVAKPLTGSEDDRVRTSSLQEEKKEPRRPKAEPNGNLFSGNGGAAAPTLEGIRPFRRIGRCPSVVKPSCA